jgi:(p)ppGpp synthase/HD superfamily hydrolase
MTSSKGVLRHRFMGEVDQLKQADRALIQKAVMYAEEMHEGQYRMSNKLGSKPEPFIVHPLKVALIILEELGLKDQISVCGALLQDVVENSGGRVTTGNIEREFGRNIALMVSILTKPLKDPSIPRNEQLATYYDRISRANIPTRLVKLAGRLDNMRDAIDLFDLEFQRQYVHETIDVYVPMAQETDQYLHAELLALCERLEQALRLGSSP